MGREHWVETTLNNVVISKKGKKPHILQTEPFNNSQSYIDIEAFETGRVKKYADIESSSNCTLKDVLVVWDGARFGLAGTNQEGATGSTLACLTPIILETSFLYKFIQRHYITIQQKPKGMATPHVDPELFWNLKFSLPPLNEQKRIVEKLDALLPKVQSAKARLDRVPVILKKFRQSVLAAACSGRLTEDWRNEYVQRTGNDLPEWEEVTLDTISQIILGKMLDKLKNNGSPTKYIRNINVRWNRFDLDDLYEMKASNNDLEKYAINNGDILVCEGGEPGRCAIWRNGPNNFIFQKAIHRVRLNKNCIPEWINYNLKLNSDTGHLEKYFTGTTIKHLTLESLKRFLIPLPPFEEQHEIVRRVERLFALADSLEAKYRKAMERVEKIEQSILAKAFRGEMAEPDPDDEPAEELLKRIMEEKAKLEGEKIRAKKKGAAKRTRKNIG